MKRIQHNDFKMYTPPGVHIELTNYCQQNSISKSPERDFFKYIFIVSHITTYSLQQKTNRECCNINIEMLSKILGTRNGETINMLFNLVNLGIIQKVASYQTGIRSSSYTILNRNSNWEQIVALPKYSLIPSKLIAKKNKLRGNPNNDLKIYKRFMSNITIDTPSNYILTQDHADENQELKFNSSVSTSFSSSSYFSSPSFSTPNPVNIPLMLGEFSHNIDPEKVSGDLTKRFCTTKTVNSHFLSLDAINDGNWFAHRPDKQSRVHTNLTNLKSDFRNFLRYNGKPFIELDIRNSQPLIASILIRDYWTKKSKLIPVDVIRYQKDCEVGTFYDYFMDLNQVLSENRGEFKIQMFGEVFFSKVSRKKTRLKQQFIERYPSAYEAICNIKGGEGSKSYNQFAIQLQRKEANIIFDNVNMKLLRAGIPAFNIFDSILCLLEHKEIVKKTLLDGFSSFDITPTINYKVYGQVCKNK